VAHVGDLDAAAVPGSRNRWEAVVTVTVHDAAEAPVANATVSGNWIAGTNGGGTCDTDAAGMCSISKANLKGNVASVSFQITGVTGTSGGYNAGANHDTDDDSDGTTVTVFQSGPPANQNPVASFTYSCDEPTPLECSFDASASSDGDGSIANWSWTFGDGANGAGENPTHAYGLEDDYTVVLTVTDNDGATDTDTQTVSVGSTPPPPGAITLTANGYKTKGVKIIDLSWNGDVGTNYIVTRDGNPLATVAGTGDPTTYTDDTGEKGAGAYVYQACIEGASTCSAEVTVVFETALAPRRA